MINRKSVDVKLLLSPVFLLKEVIEAFDGAGDRSQSKKMHSNF